MMRPLLAPLVCAAITGCTVIEHIQVLPTFNKQEQPGCCVIYAEVPPAKVSLAVSKTNTGASVRVGASWKF